jgi:4-diphosphocytidyl-2C-methyl-D-erythritol kinase
VRDLGVGTYQLTGSGSALFGLFDTEREASDSTTAIRQSEGVRVALACTTA